MSRDQDFATTGGGAIEKIPYAECLELLSTEAVGRIAVADFGTAPLVVPVNFLLDGESIVFRMDFGSKFRLAVLGEQPVSFQVDHLDLGAPAWSVLVQGVAREIEDQTGRLDLHPWASGNKRHWVRIVPRTISGRRLRFAPRPDDDGR